MINFIEKNIAGIEVEQVEEYSTCLVKLYKWLLNTIELRKEDIVKRKEHKEKLKAEREALIEQEHERCLRRDEQMEEAKTVRVLL